MADLDPPRAERLDDPEYADVESALEQLAETVHEVLAADREQVRDALFLLRESFPSVWTMVSQQLNDSAHGAAERLEARLTALEGLVAEKLAPHAEVPARLEAERDRERGQGEAIAGIAVRVRELVDVEAWTGEAADGYRRAALVQAAALEELAGVADSSANALDRSALLNRAAFFYVAEAVSFTTAQVRALRAGDATQLFSRSRTAGAHLGLLTEKLAHELEAISAGQPARELAAGLESLLGMPAILLPSGWPSGGDAADVAPSPTAGVIPALG